MVLASSVVLTYSPETGQFGFGFALFLYMCLFWSICGAVPSARHPQSDSRLKASAAENVLIGLCFPDL